MKTHKVQIIQSCVEDACAHKDIQTAIKSTVTLYTRLCQENGAEVCDYWRENTLTCLFIYFFYIC